MLTLALLPFAVILSWVFNRQPLAQGIPYWLYHLNSLPHNATYIASLAWLFLGLALATYFSRGRGMYESNARIHLAR
jgi:hypothetical protein